MLQRQQTLWLILATAAAILSFTLPFATGKIMVKGVETEMVLQADSTFLLMILTGCSILLSAGIIFLYKDRKLQIKLCLLGLLLAAGIIVLYILRLKDMTRSTLALYSVLPFLVLVSYYLAFRNIRKDEKLIKSLEKIR
ncbi:MAG: DUF4293 domain-containing protein [Chitinophagaceae bacterium]